MTAWVTANWKWAAPVLVYVLTNIANGVMKHPQLETALHRIIDFLSILTHSDSPGTFKLPGMKSRAPAGKIQMPTGKP
jgi:hypothetical protein